MRISAEAKRETRARILEVARRLFETRGYGCTATRDLAGEAGIAAGTLFNYFPTKEALAMTLVTEALERSEQAFEERRRGGESLEEDLFAHVAAGLRELDPHRPFLGEVFEVAMSPFGRSALSEQGEVLRVRHLETVARLLEAHGRGGVESFVSIHLYWTLYLGMLAFWSRDGSPKQEDTLVVLDRSLRLFVASIEDPELPGSLENRP